MKNLKHRATSKWQEEEDDQNQRRDGGRVGAKKREEGKKNYQKLLAIIIALNSLPCWRPPKPSLSLWSSKCWPDNIKSILRTGPPAREGMQFLKFTKDSYFLNYAGGVWRCSIETGKIAGSFTSGIVIILSRSSSSRNNASSMLAFSAVVGSDKSCSGILSQSSSQFSSGGSIIWCGSFCGWSSLILLWFSLIFST